MNSDIVNKIIAQAQEAAEKHGNAYNPRSAREAYARGVRDMAGIVSACANVARRMCDEQDRNSVSYTMLKGYADGLTHIAKSADDLIPPGYEY